MRSGAAVTIARNVTLADGGVTLHVTLVRKM
jgi:hypothetical protein